MSHHLCGKNVVGKKSRMMEIRDHLNFWWNQTVKNQQMNSQLCLIVQRELKVVGLNSWGAMEKGHVVWWVQIYPVPGWWADYIIIHSYTEWPGFLINGFFFFLPCWHGHILKWQYHDSSGSTSERRVQGARHINFTNGLATTESRLYPPSGIFGMWLETALSSSPTFP